MLIEFSVANYLSFKDKVTFSMEASEDVEYRDSNVFTHKKYDLLKSAVVYGANSSGKSNLLQAIAKMQSLVLTSFNNSSNSKLDIEHFRLSTETENQPSFFEIIFSIEKTEYKYSFEVDNEKVFKEQLAQIKIDSEVILFSRLEQNIELYHEFTEYKGLETKTRKNALFLNVLDQFASKTASEVVKWFKNSLNIVSKYYGKIVHLTFEMLNREISRFTLLDFYKKLNLGFQDIKLEKSKIDNNIFANLIPKDDYENLKDKIVDTQVEVPKTYHNIYGSKNQIVGSIAFDLGFNESEGTNKIVHLSGILLDVLYKGSVLLIDELDESLHQLLTLEIIKLFHSKETNPNNAQLIFTTHDASLLKKDYLKEEANFRNDQVYFLEKNEIESSQLTSLFDFDLSDLNDQNSLDKHYLLGRFGAIPTIDSSIISIR